jgi:hypothetical protein
MKRIFIALMENILIALIIDKEGVLDFPTYLLAKSNGKKFTLFLNVK